MKRVDRRFRPFNNKNADIIGVPFAFQCAHLGNTLTAAMPIIYEAGVALIGKHVVHNNTGYSKRQFGI